MKVSFILVLILMTCNVHADSDSDALERGLEISRERPIKDLFPGDSIVNILNQRVYPDSYKAFPGMTYLDFGIQGFKFL